ncbi:flagellar protein F [groundwater metagenome]
MGFAASITIAVFFLAFLVIGAVTYPVFFKSFESIKDSMDEKHRLQMDKLNTRISILSLLYVNGSSINMTVSNTGSTILRADRSNVLVNGSLVNYSVSQNLWLPAKNVTFTVNASTNHRIKITTENGISIYTGV